jgi:hypothetical protein
VRGGVDVRLAVEDGGEQLVVEVRGVVVIGHVRFLGRSSSASGFPK